jgi:hypothetical protein
MAARIWKEVEYYVIETPAIDDERLSVIGLLYPAKDAPLSFTD